MATNAGRVFDLAMNLMDEVNEQTGSTETADTKEYRVRTLAILNILRVELFPASDTYTVTAPGKRPICPEITDFESPIGLDDGLCEGVMPYGLAAHLLLDENPTAASYYNARYVELLNQYRYSIPIEGSEAIANPYGGFEHCQFSKW